MLKIFTRAALKRSNTLCTVEYIRALRLCHGCGICEAVCPQDAIEMVYDRRHRNYVPIVNHKRCKECGLCLDICPGKEVNFAEISKRFLGGVKYDILSGHYIRNYFAWAADDDIRWRAASGGIATALAKFLLTSGQVDKVIVVKSASEEEDCLTFQGTVVSDVNELYGTMGSKYCSLPLCSALGEVQRHDRLAVFGLPCHIHGIRKAQMVHNVIGKIDMTLIGIFCGATVGKEGTECLIRRHGYHLSKLASINYRGNGWPGEMVVDFSDNSKLRLSYADYYDRQFTGFTPWRCFLCSDGMAELADLSIGDAWLKEVSSNNDQGVSMVIARSERGQKVFKEAISAGAIEYQRARDDDAVRSQYKMLVRKKCGIASNMLLAKMIGRGAPQYDNIETRTVLSSILLQAKEQLLQLVGRSTAKHKSLYILFRFVRPFFKKLVG